MAQPFKAGHRYYLVAVVSLAVAAALRTLGLRLGFVDRNITAFKVGTVEHRDSAGRLAVVAHFDKTKAFGPSGVAVSNNPHRVNRTGLGK